MAIPFNVERFKSELTNGGARPNQFTVDLRFPNYVQSGSRAAQKASFLISVAELPGQTIGLAPVYYRGRLVKMAGDREFAPFNCTVINDSGFAVRTALEQWMSGIEDLQNKRGRINPAQYQQDMSIKQLDRNGAILKEYTLRGSFPVEIGPVALDFGSNDQLSTFGVSFQYQSFTSSSNPATQLLDTLIG